MAETVNSNPSPSFSKERLECCEKAYSLELARKEEIERKSRFHLSLIVILLGVLSLKIGDVSLLGSPPSDKSVSEHPLLIGIYMELLAFSFAVLLTLVSIAFVYYPRSYNKPYPKSFVSYLFSPDTKYCVLGNRASLIDANARRYALATEISRESNEQKAVWLKRTSMGAFWSLAFFAFLLITAIAGRVG